MVYPQKEQHVPHERPAERLRDDQCHAFDRERLEYLAPVPMPYACPEMSLRVGGQFAMPDFLPPISLEFPNPTERFHGCFDQQAIPAPFMPGCRNEIGAIVGSFFGDRFPRPPFAENFFPPPLAELPQFTERRGFHHPHRYPMPFPVPGVEFGPPVLPEIDMLLRRPPVYEVGPRCYNMGWRPEREDCYPPMRWGHGFHGSHRFLRPNHDVPTHPGRQGSVPPVGHGSYPNGIPG